MLSNACFLAKFRFDTAENEPGKNLQNFAHLTLSPHAVQAKTEEAAAGESPEAAAAAGDESAAPRLAIIVGALDRT